MQEATIAAITAGVLSGLFGGGIAAWGAWFAVKAGVRDLEATERRRQKISCAINLYGLRYVVSSEPVQRDEDRTQFMFEMGRAAALFADDPEVQKKLRDFYSAVQSNTQLQREAVARQQSGKPDLQDAGRLQATSASSTSLLVEVIKELSRAAKFPVHALSDSDLRNIFTVPLSNPSGFSTVIVNAPQQPGPVPSSAGTTRVDK
jgi:hypothetical protein